MIASTEPLVERLLHAQEAIGARLHPMIVAGAGTTVATCYGQETCKIGTWSGLIEMAMRDAAANNRAGTVEERIAILEDADRCKAATSAEELIAFCDEVCAIYGRADLDISQWIFDRLTELGRELDVRIRNQHLPPLLTEIRSWQASLGAVIATTNYDSLLTVAGCGKPIELHEEPLAERTSSALADILAGAHNVIHLHGRYDRDGSAVFSGAQYQRKQVC